jgi:hypothetical protein
MLRDSFFYPGVAVSLDIEDQPAFGRRPQNRFEGRTRHHHIGVR